MTQYADNETWAERSGIGLRIVDENVGTGSGSGTQSFDLDKDNIISNTYTLSSGTTGSNELTPLTETTHYTLDKESGRVVITPAGSTAIAQDIIYATYWYTDQFSDSIVTDLLTNATAQVDKLTGKYWGSGTTRTEYHNGRRSSDYPTTDRPYQSDWEQPDFIVLKQYPVIKVDEVFFLSNPIDVGKFFNYDDGTSAFTDKTTAVNSSTQAPFILFDDAPATGDIVYIGATIPFLGMDINLSTVGVGASTIDWEYYNGTSWVDLTETEQDSGASTFTASGKFTWTYPYGWAKSSVNSTTLYWIRGTLTDNYSTDPQVATISLTDGIAQILEPRQILFQSNGMLNFMGTEIPSGQKNIRVGYTYGLTTTPSYIVELTTLLASEQAFMSITGSSYDDATGYTLGSKQIQIGEAWVNVKQVLEEIRKKKQQILDMCGSRGNTRAI